MDIWDAGDPNAPPLGAIDPGALGRSPEGDPAAWAAAFASIYRRAQDLIESELADKPSGHPGEVRRLIRAYSDDRDEIDAALYSAKTSFLRHFEAEGKPEVRSDDDLVAVLIHITYKRWRRQNDRDRRLRDAAAAGAGRGEGGGPTRIEQVADPHPSPERLAEVADFLEKMHEEARYFCRCANDKNRKIVSLLMEQRNPKEICRRLKVTDAQVSKMLMLLRAHLTQRMRDALD
jgi:hypothetical protein